MLVLFPPIEKMVLFEERAESQIYITKAISPAKVALKALSKGCLVSTENNHQTPNLIKGKNGIDYNDTVNNQFLKQTETTG